MYQGVVEAAKNSRNAVKSRQISRGLSHLIGLRVRYGGEERAITRAPPDTITEVKTSLEVVITNGTVPAVIMLKNGFLLQIRHTKGHL